MVHFVDDEKEGEEAAYHPNGTPSSSRHYQKGLLHGWSREWDKKENLLFEAYYTLGKKDGPLRKYDAKGALKVDRMYKDDQVRNQ